MTSKNHSKNRNQPELESIFSQTLKLKKTPNMNSPHQMKSLDTNIVRFGGLN
jgi:hypothetical protein